jgi:hypothetical protein
MEHPLASTALSVVAAVTLHEPEYRVSEVPVGTPVFPAPGHAPDEVVAGGVVGALDDVLGLDDDVVVRGVVDEELDGVELDELEDGCDVDAEVVLVRACHHGGLGLCHHPPPYASASLSASAVTGTAVSDPEAEMGAATPWISDPDARPRRAVAVAMAESSIIARSAVASREIRMRAAACLGRYERIDAPPVSVDPALSSRSLIVVRSGGLPDGD